MQQLQKAFLSTPALTSAFSVHRRRNTMGTSSSALNRDLVQTQMLNTLSAKNLVPQEAPRKPSRAPELRIDDEFEITNHQFRRP